MAAQMLEFRKDSIGVHAAVCGEFRTVHWHSANSVSGCSCMDAPFPGAWPGNTYLAELPPPLLLLGGSLGSCCSHHYRCCCHALQVGGIFEFMAEGFKETFHQGLLIENLPEVPCVPMQFLLDK